MAVHTLTRLTFAAPNAPPVFATDGIGWGRTRKRAPGSQGRLWHTRDTVLVTSNFATHPICCCSRCKLRADSCQCGTPIPCALFPVACPHPRVCDHLRGQSCSYAVCSERPLPCASRGILLERMKQGSRWPLGMTVRDMIGLVSSLRSRQCSTAGRRIRMIWIGRVVDIRVVSASLIADNIVGRNTCKAQQRAPGSGGENK